MTCADYQNPLLTQIIFKSRVVNRVSQEKKTALKILYKKS